MPATSQCHDVFGHRRPVIGMVHAGALPGTPQHVQSIDALCAAAATDAARLTAAGFDAIIVENMHDVPYLRRDVGPEIVAAMTAIGRAVRDAAPDLPLGVQILAGANRAAVAVAHAIGARFVRAEGFVFAAVADEGLLDEADAGPLLRYRKAIGGEDIAIVADIKKKHSSHAITADLDLCETAKAALFCGADGLVVTGTATGQLTSPAELAAVRAAVQAPLLAGSGGTPDRVPALFEAADGLIVGSWIKFDGDWRQPVCPTRARELVDAVNAVRAC